MTRVVDLIQRGSCKRTTTGRRCKLSGKTTTGTVLRVFPAIYPNLRAVINRSTSRKIDSDAIHFRRSEIVLLLVIREITFTWRFVSSSTFVYHETVFFSPPGSYFRRYVIPFYRRCFAEKHDNRNVRLKRISTRYSIGTSLAVTGVTWIFFLANYKIKCIV